MYIVSANAYSYAYYSLTYVPIKKKIMLALYFENLLIKKYFKTFEK
jgi:hypothetical protein